MTKAKPKSNKPSPKASSAKPKKAPKPIAKTQPESTPSESKAPSSESLPVEPTPQQPAKPKSSKGDTSFSIRVAVLVNAGKLNDEQAANLRRCYEGGKQFEARKVVRQLERGKQVPLEQLLA